MLHYDDHLQFYAILDPIETKVLDLDKIYNNNLWHLVHMPGGFTHILYYDLRGVSEKYPTCVYILAPERTIALCEV